MDDYLSKPLRTHELQAVLRRWLGGSPDQAPPRPHTAVLDIEPLLENLGGNREVVRHVLTLFLEQGDSLRADMAKALAQSQLNGVDAMAHKLAGSAAQVGAPEVSRLAAAIEGYAQAGDLAACRSAMTQLEAANAKVKDVAEEILAKLPDVNRAGSGG